MTPVGAPDLVRTHDEARALLRYAVLGAEVEIYRARDNSRHAERVRGYQIVTRAMGREVVCVTGSYVLPTPAHRLAQSAREAVESALRAKKHDG